jgi:ribosomal protein L17
MHCQECEFVVEATGALFQVGLITNTMKVVREYSTIIDEMLKMAADADLEAENLASDVARTGVTTVNSVEKQKDYNRKLLQVPIDFCFEQRQTAVECLFFFAYHVLMSAVEVAEALDLTKHLVNGTAWSTSNGIYLHQFGLLLTYHTAKF